MREDKINFIRSIFKNGKKKNFNNPNLKFCLSSFLKESVRDYKKIFSYTYYECGSENINR